MIRGIGILTLLLASCSTVTPTVVKVPVYKKMEFQIPVKPRLALTSLKPNASIMDIEKAQVVDLDALTSYSDQLLTILKTLQGNAWNSQH